MASIDIGSLVLNVGGVAYSWSRETSKRKESIGEWKDILLEGWRGKVKRQVRIDCEQLINAKRVDGKTIGPGVSSWASLFKSISIGPIQLNEVDAIVNVEGENVYFINNILSCGVTARCLTLVILSLLNNVSDNFYLLEKTDIYTRIGLFRIEKEDNIVWKSSFVPNLMSSRYAMNLSDLEKWNNVMAYGNCTGIQMTDFSQGLSSLIKHMKQMSSANETMNSTILIIQNAKLSPFRTECLVSGARVLDITAPFCSKGLGNNTITEDFAKKVRRMAGCIAVWCTMGLSEAERSIFSKECSIKLSQWHDEMGYDTDRELATAAGNWDGELGQIIKEILDKLTLGKTDDNAAVFTPVYFVWAITEAVSRANIVNSWICDVYENGLWPVWMK